MPEATDAIISIHRGHAEAILTGRKTVELRRRFPEVPLGTRLWIYATRPTGAILGFAKIHDVDRGSPPRIWNKHRDGAAIDRSAFQKYFEGAEEAIAILLATARTTLPIPLEELNRIRNCFHPPQVLLRLTASETKAMRALAGSRKP